MSDSTRPDFPETVRFADPVACYTESEPLDTSNSVKEYIRDIPYQHDPVTAIHLSWVLRQMPDEMKEFPYLGVPLSQIQALVEDNPLLDDATCQVVIGLGLNEDELQTVDDIPTIDDTVNISEFRDVITSAQSSVDRLFTDVEVFTFQYTDPRQLESNHTVVYADTPDRFDYFIGFQDHYAFDGISGGKTFTELDPVEFTDTIAGILHLKSKLRIDGYRSDGANAAYDERFVTPLVTPFGAATDLYNIDLSTE